MRLKERKEVAGNESERWNETATKRQGRDTANDREEVGRREGGMEARTEKCEDSETETERTRRVGGGREQGWGGPGSSGQPERQGHLLVHVSMLRLRYATTAAADASCGASPSMCSSPSNLFIPESF